MPYQALGRGPRCANAILFSEEKYTERSEGLFFTIDELLVLQIDAVEIGGADRYGHNHHQHAEHDQPDFG